MKSSITVAYALILMLCVFNLVKTYQIIDIKERLDHIEHRIEAQDKVIEYMTHHNNTGTCGITQQIK